MLSEYSCQRATNRWPLAIFYNILDIAALAAFIISKEKGLTTKNNRRKFIQEISLNLCMSDIFAPLGKLAYYTTFHHSFCH